MSTAPIDISMRQAQPIRGMFRRDSFAHTQGMGGISWGGVSVGSWLREEVLHNHGGPSKGTAVPSGHHMANNGQHPPNAGYLSTEDIMPAYYPHFEADFCKDYACCGQDLPTLHDLLLHYEQAHISHSPPMESPVLTHTNPQEMVLTNEVFLGNTHHQQHQLHQQQQQQHHHQQDHQQHQITQSRDPDMFGRVGQLQGDPNIPLTVAPRSTTTGPIHGVNSLASSPRSPLKDEDGDLCIDDPARHLYVSERTDAKPYKCPVNGCDKSYKNQNGLKYHRLHGHQNQTLQENSDGTFSIIDPVSNAPYPDNQGMEKEKPYRCEICGKRYKNLNGLKYHRAHSTH